MRWKKRRMQSRARESIDGLFELAEKECILNPERAHRYMEIARNISMRTRTRMPHHLRRKLCKKCHRFLHGKNCRVRTKNGKVVITCLECGNVMRIPFIREKKEKRIKEFIASS